MESIQNRNLTISNACDFQGIPVLDIRNGLYVEYMQKTLDVMEHISNKYSRVFAVRVDLHIPNTAQKTDSGIITRFLESLKAQIKHDCLQRSQASMGPVHSSDVAYIWVKESSNTGHSHYHICLFFNGYAYRCLGLFQLGRNNLYNRIHKAWASATNTPIELMQGSIHIPENAQYQLLRSSPEFQSVFNDLFRRLSYFSKIDTKEYGDRSRHFGCSRV